SLANHFFKKFVRIRGRPSKLYKNTTRVRPESIGSNRHEPANLRKNHGPRVITTAHVRGGENVVYCVSIPMPFLDSHHARTPRPAHCASPTSRASRKNRSHSHRRS